MSAPVRLRLSRAKGFDLQAVSKAINGRPAVNVARPSPWGNPFRRGDTFDVTHYGAHCNTDGWLLWKHGTPGERRIVTVNEPLVLVGLFAGFMDRFPRDLTPLRGKNLACWCALDKPCHATVLLKLANPKTEEAYHG